MLYVLPLEPLEERYTKEWLSTFDSICRTQNVDKFFVYGESLGDTVEVGTVLDAAGTNFWKATQMAEVTEMFKSGRIKDGDKFFTFDLWHPGLEMIPYMAQLYGVKVEIYGFLHAGSYTTMDFAEPMGPWAKHFELGWATIVDKIFVGTEYHKNKFLNKRVPQELKEEISKKIVVTGNPVIHHVSQNKIPANERENIIVFSHRFDVEKGIFTFLMLMELMSKLYGSDAFKVVFTTSRKKFKTNAPGALRLLEACSFDCEIKEGLTKQEYYEVLKHSKVFVSTTLEENFGYCLTDAITRGVIPVVVNDFSHPEIVGEEFLYNSLIEAAEKIMYYLKKETPTKLPSLKKYWGVWEQILEEMGYVI